MEPFSEKEEVTTTSKLVGILPGSPPRINLVDYASGRNGVKRHMTQQVPVLDADLFTKLQAEVKIGEQIRATTINEFTETGSSVYLAGFQKLSETAADDTESRNYELSQLPLTTSVIESTRQAAKLSKRTLYQQTGLRTTIEEN